MKKIKYLILVLTIACSGCDILDMPPRGELTENDVITNENGYKELLIGAYINMASKNLYGCNMSFYFPELLAQTWGDVSSNASTATHAKAWNLTSSYSEALIETIWRQHYYTINALNNIIDNIDDYQNVFKNGNHQLIKGEALGLRAFLHLELLRLFGPIPSKGAGESAIVYSELHSRDPKFFKTATYDVVISKILRDLDAAEELLANDPLIISTNEQLNGVTEWDNIPADSWQMKRQIRFNYYAVKAAKARYYHWIGDKTNALKYAMEVIESGKFRLANPRDFLSGSGSDFDHSLVMLSEQIFGVHNPEHQSVIKSSFVNQKPHLQTSEANIKTLHEGYTSDVRNVMNRFWKVTVATELATPQNHFLKYSGNDVLSSPNKIPIIRLSEMYFIAVQSAPVSDPGATALFSEYLQARGLPTTILDEMISDNAILKRMEKEHMKEFIGEGQMFYFYKKNEYMNYTWPSNFEVPSTYANYKIPLPKSQTPFD